MLDYHAVQFVNGTALSAGQTDGVLVAAIPGRRIRVLRLMVFPTTTPPASIVLNSKGSGSGTAISPVFPVVAATPLSVGGGDTGICQTNAGEALTVTNPAGTTLAVFMVAYVVI